MLKVNIQQVVKVFFLYFSTCDVLLVVWTAPDIQQPHTNSSYLLCWRATRSQSRLGSEQESSRSSALSASWRGRFLNVWLRCWRCRENKAAVTFKTAEIWRKKMVERVQQCEMLSVKVANNPPLPAYCAGMKQQNTKERHSAIQLTCQVLLSAPTCRLAQLITATSESQRSACVYPW